MKKKISIFCCSNCKCSFSCSYSVNVQLLDCEFERTYMLNEVKPAIIPLVPITVSAEIQMF